MCVCLQQVCLHRACVSASSMCVCLQQERLHRACASVSWIRRVYIEHVRLHRACAITYLPHARVNFIQVWYNKNIRRSLTVTYQTLNEAISGEHVNNRFELVDKLSARFAAYHEMLDIDLVALANQYRAEKITSYTDEFTFNDPIDW
jgi:hypothetical protein